MSSTLLPVLDRSELLDSQQQTYEAFHLSRQVQHSIELRFRNGDIRQRPCGNLAVDLDASGTLTLYFPRHTVILEGRKLTDRKFLDGLLDRRVRWIAEHPDTMRSASGGGIVIERIIDRDLAVMPKPS